MASGGVRYYISHAGGLFFEEVREYSNYNILPFGEWPTIHSVSAAVSRCAGDAHGWIKGEGGMTVMFDVTEYYDR